jgi:hypothetical protein
VLFPAPAMPVTTMRSPTIGSVSTSFTAPKSSRRPVYIGEEPKEVEGGFLPRLRTWKPLPEYLAAAAPG